MFCGVIARYRAYLPVSERTPVVTLNEGNTPLIEAPRLASLIHPEARLYLKFEGANPTGSFKDRGMTLAISKALEEGAQAVICASTGNTSASAAAYAARAGMRCFVLLPQGKVALGKLTQALMHGAQVLQVEGNFDDALRLVRAISEQFPITIVNSVNPYRAEGQKTAAFEICDDLGDAPDYHAIPVGNARNIASYWMGYREYYALGKTTRLPKMLGFQAAGAAPFIHGHPIEKPETIATAIRIGNPAGWNEAIQAQQESGGLFCAVSDEEILDAYRLLARLEGVFAEPASVAPIAGLLKLAQEGYFQQPCTIAVTLTGHGLKDPDTALLASACEPLSVPVDYDAVVRAMGLKG
ncbi:L-threonine synthase [Armatimonadetes bacterium GBS]|jgi:threonine synthase|nr:Threonine synthase [bacterium HR14]GIV13685.1 MAG: threonine synthase [Fimbriimonadales bacterium]CUU02236.1 L-threonine synthase [Armatimonadetes bacterium GBS]CUU35625.1 L-threonine synthase [Armatimonadetes bacterium GXS]